MTTLDDFTHKLEFRVDGVTIAWPLSHHPVDPQTLRLLLLATTAAFEKEGIDCSFTYGPKEKTP